MGRGGSRSSASHPRPRSSAAARAWKNRYDSFQNQFSYTAIPARSPSG